MRMYLMLYTYSDDDCDAAERREKTSGSNASPEILKMFPFFFFSYLYTRGNSLSPAIPFYNCYALKRYRNKQLFIRFLFISGMLFILFSIIYTLLLLLWSISTSTQTKFVRKVLCAISNIWINSSLFISVLSLCAYVRSGKGILFFLHSHQCSRLFETLNSNELHTVSEIFLLLHNKYNSVINE